MYQAMLTTHRSGHFSPGNSFHIVKLLFVDLQLMHRQSVIDCMINKESMERTSSSDLIASIW